MASDNQGPVIIGVTMLFWVIALVALGLRFWSLRIRRRRVFAHDLLVFLGFVSSIRPRRTFYNLPTPSANGGLPLPRPLQQLSLSASSSAWRAAVSGSMLSS